MKVVQLFFLSVFFKLRVLLRLSKVLFLKLDGNTKYKGIEIYGSNPLLYELLNNNNL